MGIARSSLLLWILVYCCYGNGNALQTEDKGKRRPIFRNNQEHCAGVDLTYRQLDGSCNHMDGYGRVKMAVKRYLPPAYDDDIGSPRTTSVHRKKFPLPSPRLISTTFHPDRPRSSKTTLLVMQFGQLIDHDITMAPTPADSETNQPIKCCNGRLSQRHKQCFPIMIPKGDPVFSDCMEFVRSDAAHDDDGNVIVPREQVNELTSFIDASSIYGTDEESLKKLRTQNGKGALLRTKTVNGKVRLPVGPDGSCERTNNPLSYCQMAGDHRVNEQPGLSSLHLVFHLHHNNLVRALVARIVKRDCGVSSDILDKKVEAFIKNSSNGIKEKLFQEVRKIMAAIIQKITYCDWLPLILGPRLMRKYDLNCNKDSRYDPRVDPRIANVFLAAAFRFGHSLIPNKIMVDYSMKGLQDMFNIPDPALFHFESIVYGLCESNMSRPFDRFISHSVTNTLFQTSMKPLDLMALNVQRGRDHGIPPYLKWRKRFKLRMSSKQLMRGKAVANQLNNIFRHPMDIDLFTAGLLEKSVPGGMIGLTFGNILGQQFSDIKKGDAYFFLHTEQPYGFTKAERKAIMDVSFASFMCYTSEMDLIQKNPFMESSQRNPLIPCRNLPKMDLTPWLDKF